MTMKTVLFDQIQENVQNGPSNKNYVSYKHQVLYNESFEGGTAQDSQSEKT